MASLEATAKGLGIPMQIEITDGIRYRSCDAHMASLVSIEGTNAIYRGQCSNRHQYEMRYNIAELKNMTHIENGEIVFGSEKGHKFDGLEDF